MLLFSTSSSSSSSSPRGLTPSHGRMLRYRNASPSPPYSAARPSSAAPPWLSGGWLGPTAVLLIIAVQSTVLLSDRQFQGLIAKSSQIYFCGTSKNKDNDAYSGGGGPDDNNSTARDGSTTPTNMYNKRPPSTGTTTSRIRSKSISDEPAAAAPRRPPPSSSTSARKYNASAPLEFDGVVARAFETWDAARRGRPLPCVEAEPGWRKMHKEPTTTGFIFAKPYKTGSSTASGVNLRIARNVARRFRRQNHHNSSNGTAAATTNTNTTTSDWEMCKSRSDHVPVSSAYAGRDRDRSFLWTVVRDPSARLVSQFFHFHIAREKHEPTDAVFREYALRGPTVLIHDYYYFALSMGGFDPGRDDRRKLANEILAEYDFIGTTERMDESFVVMSMLLGIPLSDVTYLKAKGRGGFDDGGGRPEGVICTYIWPSFVSPGMREFLDSDEWKNVSHWDRVLHQAADRSLDLTIDRLGRETVAANVARYRKLQVRGRDACLHRTTFPCSEGGDLSWATDCLWRDSGCGCECLDEVAERFGV